MHVVIDKHNAIFNPQYCQQKINILICSHTNSFASCKTSDCNLEFTCLGTHLGLLEYRTNLIKNSQEITPKLILHLNLHCVSRHVCHYDVLSGFIWCFSLKFALLIFKKNSHRGRARLRNCGVHTFSALLKCRFSIEYTRYRCLNSSKHTG